MIHLDRYDVGALRTLRYFENDVEPNVMWLPRATYDNQVNQDNKNRQGNGQDVPVSFNVYVTKVTPLVSAKSTPLASRFMVIAIAHGNAAPEKAAHNAISLPQGTSR